MEWACLKAYPNQQSDSRKQNVRRHRHDRGTSTPQAHSNDIPIKRFKTHYHGRAQRSAPTQKFVHSQRNQANVTRGAGWDVEREGRETKLEPPTRLVPLCTGDFGTSVRHPSRERIVMKRIRYRGLTRRHSPAQSSSIQPPSNLKTSQPTRAH